MEFPHHRHHRRNSSSDDEERERRPQHMFSHTHGYPPPAYPPAPAFVVQHESYRPPGVGVEPPVAYPPAPAFVVQHESYRPPGVGVDPPVAYPPAPAFVAEHESYRPREPGEGFVVHHESRRSPEFGPGEGFPASASNHRHGPHHRVLPQGQTVRVFCKANPHFSVAIRDGKVVLAPSDSNDERQQWIRDESCSTRIKDERGFPSFALVNKATGLALKHGLGESQPVQLTEYQPDKLDESILWSMSEDMGEGYRTIRHVNDIRMNLDAFHADKKSGGVKDGTPVVVWKWKKGENQIWKIVPY